MKTRVTFYRRTELFWDFRVASVLFMLLFLPHCTECCWGREAPKYGDMTRDYDLLVGNELVLNCSLNSNQVEIGKKPYSVNSSQLFLRKKGVNIDRQRITIIDDLTAQFRKPNASLSDSGIYLCQLSIPELASDHMVCSSQVNIGYQPRPVKNFKCVSKYYKNLTCSWEVPDNGIQTKYMLYKRNYLFANYFNNPKLQRCPTETANNTYCQWRGDTDPPFEIYEKIFRFEVLGNNSLGYSNQTFILKHEEIFMPRRPESIVVATVNKKNVTIQWSPPDEIHGIQQPPLMYQMWLQELTGENGTEVFDIGIDVISYTIFGLEPYMLYNISLRCRSVHTNSSELWSSFVSTQTRTLPDVPYYVPEIAPEAFELRHYDGYRTVTLYWKPISIKYYNGENFIYHVVCSEKSLPSNNMVPTTKTINTTSLSVTFTNLQKDVGYSFHLYTMNKEGLSSTYKAIFVDNQEKLPDPPESITAISYDIGHYKLSWKPPSKNSSSIVDYVVFWCSSAKPWLSRCESPIQWLSAPLLGNNVTLNLSDSSTNFQFAIVARTTVTSSGMQWATCIVPSKAALGKIGNVILIPNSSRSLKVIWRLDCPAQKAVVQKIEIDYCKTDEKQKCQDKKQSLSIFNSSLENYTIENLNPFTNYSVVIRAYNQAGVASEDSDPKFRTTWQGEPSDPPQNIEIAPISDTTLRISWKKPLQPNGIITRYVLRYNNEEEIIPVNKDQDALQWQINNLSFYTYYNVSLVACVKHFCSPSSEGILVRMGIGVPRKMDPPRVETVNSTFIRVSWNPPLTPNGPIDFYEVQWKAVNTWNESEKDDHMKLKVVNKELSTVVEMKCSKVEDGGIKYGFSIRAANVRDGIILYGPLSDNSQIQACSLSQGLALLIGVAIGGTLALAFVMLMVYKLIKWMSDKIHQVKSITVRLPKGLDGPEINPLNNYENFKNGLLPQPLNNNNNIGRLSYIVDDYDKNRHGSGSSQNSFLSTDELLHKNGKCTKFTRKSSGESSGCSSMSSRLQTSCSSTESDFMTPPSPVISFPERSSQGGHKGNLPIVIEGQASVTSDGTAMDNSCSEVLEPEEKNSTIAGGVVLKVDQPYSKFGISNNPGVIPLWWVNPLTFYNNSLSNSEPAVTDIKEPVTVFVPYSKVGLTKSSGDILGLKQIDADVGYSRFGVLAASDADTPHSELEKSFLPSGLKKNEHGINDLFDKYRYSGKPVERSNVHENGDFLHISPLLADAHIPFETAMSEVHGDSGYIKFRRPNPKPMTTQGGYVPFHELSSMSNKMPASNSLLADDDLQKISMDEVEVPSPEDDLHQNVYDNIDLLSNYLPSADDVFSTKDSEAVQPCAQGQLKGGLEPAVDPVTKDLLNTDGELTVSRCAENEHELLLESSMNSSLNLAPAFAHAKVEPHSLDSPSPETSLSVRTKVVPSNGYVSFAELWNLHSEGDSSMPNEKNSVKDHPMDEVQPLGDSNCHHSVDTDTHETKPSIDGKQPSDVNIIPSATEHQVHPTTDNIPRCRFASPHSEPQSLTAGTCNGFASPRLVDFLPIIESEICEV